MGLSKGTGLIGVEESKKFISQYWSDNNLRQYVLQTTEQVNQKCYKRELKVQFRVLAEKEEDLQEEFIQKDSSNLEKYYYIRPYQPDIGEEGNDWIYYIGRKTKLNKYKIWLDF